MSQAEVATKRQRSPLAIEKSQVCTKRPRSLHEANDCNETIMEAQSVYLLRLAAEMNNVGAELLDLGNNDDDTVTDARDMCRDAFKLAMEADALPSKLRHDVKLPEDDEDEETLIVSSLAKLREGREKLAAVAVGFGKCSDNGETDPGESSGDDNDLALCRTALLSDTIKIDLAASEHIRLGTELFPAITMFNIGNAFCRCERWDLAFKMFEAALKICRSSEEDDEHGTALKCHPRAHCALLNNLGHIYYLRGQKDEATLAFSEALRLAQETLELKLHEDRGADRGEKKVDVTRQGVDDDDNSAVRKCIATILYNRGFVSYSDHEHEMAAECFIDALEYASGTTTLLLNIVVHMNYIGRAYHRNGKCKEALRIYREALRVRSQMMQGGGGCKSRKSTLPAEVYSNILLNVGYIYFRSGRADLAIEAFSFSLRLLRSALGVDHPLVTRLVQHIDDASSKFLPFGRKDDIAAAA